MSRTLLASILSAALLSLFVAPASHAGSFWTPIFEDDFVASAGVGDELWVVPQERAAELAAYAGTGVQVRTMNAVLNEIEGGSSPSALRLEGCHGASAVAQRLAAEGYGTVTSVAPSLAGSSYARRYGQ